MVGICLRREKRGSISATEYSKSFLLCIVLNSYFARADLGFLEAVTLSRETSPNHSQLQLKNRKRGHM